MYEISNMGNGKSNRRRKGVLKPLVNKDGYLYFILIGDDGKRHTCYIHRLVAKAFVDNDDPEHKVEINHKDEVKTNNYYTNLEWCDRLYQVRYGHCIEKGISKRKKKTVQCDLNGNIIRIWNSATDAANSLNINRNNIFLCCRGITKTSYGYIWKYV